MIPHRQKTPRSGHGCGLVDNGQGVMVVGGDDYPGDPGKSVEIFDLKKNIWREGPRLPEHLDGSPGVTEVDGVVFVACSVVTAEVCEVVSVVVVAVKYLLNSIYGTHSGNAWIMMRFFQSDLFHLDRLLELSSFSED